MVPICTYSTCSGTHNTSPTTTYVGADFALLEQRIVLTLHGNAAAYTATVRKLSETTGLYSFEPVSSLREDVFITPPKNWRWYDRFRVWGEPRKLVSPEPIYKHAVAHTAPSFNQVRKQKRKAYVQQLHARLQ